MRECTHDVIRVTIEDQGAAAVRIATCEQCGRYVRHWPARPARIETLRAKLRVLSIRR